MEAPLLAHAVRSDWLLATVGTRRDVIRTLAQDDALMVTWYPQDGRHTQGQPISVVDLCVGRCRELSTGCGIIETGFGAAELRGGGPERQAEWAANLLDAYGIRAGDLLVGSWFPCFDFRPGTLAGLGELGLVLESTGLHSYQGEERLAEGVWRAVRT
jgi:hypothetical protein